MFLFEFNLIVFFNYGGDILIVNILLWSFAGDVLYQFY